MAYGELPPEQAAALRDVDLRLLFAPNGSRAYDSRIGSYITGVINRHYVDIQAATADLIPARGDALVIEGPGSPCSKASLFNMTALMQDGLSKSRFDPQGPGETRMIDQALEDARRVRAIHTFTYAAGHALLKGVPVFYGGTTSAQDKEYREVVEELLGKRSAPDGVEPFGQTNLLERAGLFELQTTLDNMHRSAGVIRCLGEVASTVVPWGRTASSTIPG